MTTPTYRFSRVLAHPLWLAALALLIVNDHVLKSLAPGLVTGKLSDVVGLFMAPALAATLMRTHTRRGLALAHVAIAVVFAAIKLSPLAARGFEALLALGPFPWHITVDPTDLLALPALLLSWRFSLHVAARPTTTARAYTFVASGLGLTAALATSPPPGESMITADLVIGSDDPGTLVVRLRPLRDSVVVDCDAAIRNPTVAFSRELFAPAVSFLVNPSRVVQVQGDGFSVPNRACTAVLVDGTFQRGNAAAVSLPLTLLFYTRESFLPLSIPTNVGEVPDTRLVTFAVTGNAARWRAHPAVFPAPPELEREPLPGCELAPTGSTVDWQEPIPVGERTLIALDSSPDGCHRLTFETVGNWYVCTNTPLPFVVGDVIYLRAATSGQDWQTVAGVELVTDSADAPKRVLVTRGPDLAAWSSESNYTTRRVPECTGSHDECGSLLFPLEVTIDTGELRLDLTAGDFITLERGTLFLQRAESMPIRDTSCGAPLDDDHYFESVYIEPRVLETQE